MMSGIKRSFSPNIIIAVLAVLLVLALAVITNPSLLDGYWGTASKVRQNQEVSAPPVLKCPELKNVGTKVKERVVERIVYVDRTTEIPVAESSTKVRHQWYFNEFLCWEMVVC